MCVGAFNRLTAAGPCDRGMSAVAELPSVKTHWTRRLQTATVAAGSASGGATWKYA